jgi:uncharacterized protein
MLIRLFALVENSWMLKVCIDTNIWISGVLFSGKPAEIVTGAFNRKFQTIASQIILDELSKNLIEKFGLGRRNTNKFIRRITQIADLFEPLGTIRVIPGAHTDNLILETAALGRARYLVTGDKEHLLPLKRFKFVKIVNAAQFLDELRAS